MMTDRTTPMDEEARDDDRASSDQLPSPRGRGRRRGRETSLTPIAKMLRKEMTFPERLLWSRLRARQQQFKFRRQQPIGNYVADFYCTEARLIIELDGLSHRGTGLADDARQAWLEQQGIQVIRFTNDQVIQGADEVVKAIWFACQDRIGGLDV